MFLFNVEALGDTIGITRSHVINPHKMNFHVREMTLMLRSSSIFSRNESHNSQSIGIIAHRVDRSLLYDNRYRRNKANTSGTGQERDSKSKANASRASQEGGRKQVGKRVCAGATEKEALRVCS